MTAVTATILPLREGSGPPGAETGMRTQLLAVGGSTLDGQPSAALFLWAHSHYREPFEFGLHRHERLEVLSVILEGAMSHYDTASGRWADLRAGDLQMMWSGPGISHVERAAAGTRGFQIQFDPGQDIAARQRPSYQDFPAASFTARPAGDALVTSFIGDGGPIETHTEGLSARRVRVPAGSRAVLETGSGRFTLACLIGGAATVNGAHATVGAAVSLNGAATMTVEATAPTDLFSVSLPATPSYQPQRHDPSAGNPRPPWRR